MMNRRTALKNLGLSVGALGMAPAIGSLLQSCETAPSWTPQFFSGAQAQLLELLVETIIPETDIPGGKSLQLAPQLDLMVATVAEEEQKQILTQLFDQFTASLQTDHGGIAVSKVQAAHIDAQLAKYLRASAEQQQAWSTEIDAAEEANSPLTDEAASYLFAGQIRSLTVRVFKTNEYIGENVLAYAPIPGQQQGCVDLQEATGGKAWSL